MVDSLMIPADDGRAAPTEAATLRDAALSLVDWWEMAGVDAMIDEQPRNWLAADSGLDPAVDSARDRQSVVTEIGAARSTDRARSRELAQAVARPTDGFHGMTSDRAAVRAGLAPSQPSSVVPSSGAPPALSLPVHDTLAAFLAWRASDVIMLDDYAPRRRLAPEGMMASGLMIVADVPERGDSDAARILTGEAGELFDKMLSAMKIDRNDICLATLAPARPPTGLLSDDETARLAPVLMRHLSLAAPKRLWLMGKAASRAVLGMDTDKAAGKLHTVNAEGVMIQAIATLHPRVLLQEPKRKASVWADMQRLIGTDIPKDQN